MSDQVLHDALISGARDLERTVEMKLPGNHPVRRISVSRVEYDTFIYDEEQDGLIRVGADSIDIEVNPDGLGL